MVSILQTMELFVEDVAIQSARSKLGLNRGHLLGQYPTDLILSVHGEGAYDPVGPKVIRDILFHFFDVNRHSQQLITWKVDYDVLRWLNGAFDVHLDPFLGATDVRLCPCESSDEWKTILDVETISAEDVNDVNGSIARRARLVRRTHTVSPNVTSVTYRPFLEKNLETLFLLARIMVDGLTGKRFHRLFPICPKMERFTLSIFVSHGARPYHMPSDAALVECQQKHLGGHTVNIEKDDDCVYVHITTQSSHLLITRGVPCGNVAIFSNAEL